MATNKIEIVNNSNYSPTLLPQFVLLGMLDEYGGRRIIEGTDVVEGFYASESDVVTHFTFFLDQLIKESGLKASYVVKTIDSGAAYIQSAYLAEMVQSWYTYEFGESTFRDLDGRVYRTTYSEIDMSYFPQTNSPKFFPDIVDSRFSYLYGLNIRYGHNGGFRFANAYSKVKVAIQLLEDLECDWIQWHWSLKGAPTIHSLTFGPSPSLKRLLGRLS